MSRPIIHNSILSNFPPKLLDILWLGVFVLLIIASLYILHWNGILLVLLLLANIYLYLSYRYGFSLPGIARLSNYYVRINTQDFSKLNSSYFRFKFLYYFILLIHDLDSGFGLLFDTEDPLGIKFGNKKKVAAVRQEYLKEALWLHHLKKKRATMAMMVSSIFMTVAILALALIFAPRTLAATFGWIQTDWSGGISELLATHPGDKTGWDKYASKDETISTAGGNLSLSLTPSSTVESLDADFLTHSSSNTYVSGNQVLMLKPVNATCSADSECANNSCFGNTCFVCGTDTVAYEGGPYDANGLTTTTKGYYRTVLINDQCYFKDNLNAGTMIGSKLADNATLQDQADNGIIEKYCYNYVQQDNAGQIASGQADCAVYGGFYQWQEAVQYSNGVTTSTGTTVASGNIQGICPTGWHIPLDAELTTLSTYLGGDSVSGGKLKAVTTWNAPNTGADNSSGFTALGAGDRFANGSFLNRGNYSFFWSALPSGATSAWYRNLSNNSAAFDRSYDNRAYGFSVRCLKD